MATEPKIAGAAVRAAGSEILSERARAEGEQVDLFPVPVADPGGEVAAAADPIRRGAGRPPGASNRSTVALREYLLARGVLPQQAVMQQVQLGPIGLALALWRASGSSGNPPIEVLIEGAKLWQKLAADLGRYFMAPMAPADAAGKSVPMIQVNLGGGAPRDEEGNELPPWAYLDHEGNQQLIDAAVAQSKESESKE